MRTGSMAMFLAAILSFSPTFGSKAQAQAKTIQIVAAENFYADVARQLAGPQAKVTAILSNPDTDPHLFEADPSTARAIARADIVIENGADYDPWMARLLRATSHQPAALIDAADLTHRRTGANPHLWWDP